MMLEVLHLKLPYALEDCGFFLIESFGDMAVFRLLDLSSSHVSQA